MIDIGLYNSKFYKTPPKKSLPNWERWVELFQEMKVHTRGDIPVKLIEKQRPNQDIDVFNYIKKMYQPISKSSINRSINRLFRIFLNSNFSFNVSTDLEQYLKEKVFEKRAFFEYFYGTVIKRMIEDPNGYLVWLPSGEGLLEQTKKVEVKPEIIHSVNIWYVDEEVLTWRWDIDEKLPDEFWSLTKEGYYRHVLRDDHYILEEIYNHGLKAVPALVLGGVEESKGIFESYFNSFLPFGNDAINQYIDWKGVNVTSAYPFRTEKYTECDYPECQGKGWFQDEHNKTITCPLCKGTTHKPHTSVYGTFIRREKSTATGDETDNSPMIEFTSPSTDILEYSQQSWQTLLDLARKAIFDEAIEESQSGLAKLVDKEDEHAFYSSISDNVYDHLLINSLKIINGYRDINTTKEPEITKPTSFVIKTETDLVNELGVLLEKNAPLPFILETVKDLAKKRFSTNKTTAKAINFLMVYDPLFALSPEEKNMLIATNVIDDLTRSKGVNSYQVLMRLLARKPNLLDGTYDKIEAEMDKEISKLIVETKPLYDADGDGTD